MSDKLTLKAQTVNLSTDTQHTQCCEMMLRAVNANAIRIDDYLEPSTWLYEQIRVKHYYLTSVGLIRFCPWCGAGVRQ